MAGDPFRRVTPQEPLVIHAEAWNKLMDVADSHGNVYLGQPDAPLREHYQHAKILNATEATVARHQVLTITGPALTPTQNLATFSSRLALVGGVPAVGDGDVAVLLEPAQEGFLARCCVSGLAPALVNITDEDHTAAAPNASHVLQSSSRGPCTIVWKPPIGMGSNPREVLCLVRIVGRRPAGEHFAVLVTQTGGVAGDEDTTCTFTYTVKDLYGVTIGTVMSPEKRRFEDTPYVAGDTDTPGSAYYDQDGVLHLYDANELPGAEEC
jgi:hypothetical protein